MTPDSGYPAPARSADELPKAYEGLARERFWQAYWQAARIYEFSLYTADGGAGAGGAGASPASSDPATGEGARATEGVPAGDKAGTAASPTRRLRAREEIFSIDTPPPTVSGSLHIGHVYSYTQTDMTARYQRMRGKHVFYPFGFDDNGLPTERLVEREKGLKAHEYIKEHGREAFIALCREVVEKYEAQFVALWQSLALSCDWKQFYTTIGTIRAGEQEDKDLARAISQASFIDLYQKGIVYRKDAPTQWCWADQTAISQAEIEDREVPGHFHFIKFFWADGPGQPLRGELHIATTRPELIPACVAVMVAADEQGQPSTEALRTWDGRPLTDYSGQPVRHADLVGKIAVTPLFEVEVPILPSEKVQLDKGTGVLMCCTFGDMEDVEHWKQFNLPTRVIIGKDGRISGRDRGPFSELAWSTTPTVLPDEGSGYSLKKRISLTYSIPTRNLARAEEFWEALSRKKIEGQGQAQESIVKALGDEGLLLSRREIIHTVRFSERGGVKIQILVTPQWYVNILDNKEALIEQGRLINWQPDYMRKRYEQWVNGLNTDWCISRQRFNGIPFPVALDGQSKVNLPPLSLLPVNPLQVKDIDSWQAVEGSEKVDTAQDLVVTETSLPASIHPDPDVMDTWATSSVSPLLNTHRLPGLEESDAEAWAKFNQAEAAQRHALLFPFDMRPQAHDIIRTWAFYTIAKAYFHFGLDENGKPFEDEAKQRAALPWKDIVISGHAQDAARQKMSKSRGNVVTPAELVEKYTADGIRYWSGSCKLGTDTVYDEKTLGEGRKLINKLFNATKFALRHLIGFDPVGAGLIPPALKEEGGMNAAPTGQDASGTLALQDASGTLALPGLITYPTDRWLIARLNSAIERATKAQDAFDFADAKQAAEDFFWADFCDNYLELSKGRLYGEPLAVEAHPGHSPEGLKLSAQATLYVALSSILRMFAPCLPHITEECWSWYFAQFSPQRSIHEEAWPEAVGATPCVAQEDGQDKGRGMAPPLQAAELLLAALLAVRKAKSEAGVSIKKPVARLDLYLTEHAPRADDGSPAFTPAHLSAVLGDLLSTTSSRAAGLCAGPPPEGAATTERSPLAVVCEFAPDESPG